MAGPNYNSPGKFPGPYINDVKEDESVMEMVPRETMDIGARRSGLPKASDMAGDPARSMTISHVGGTAGKG